VTHRSDQQIRQLTRKFHRENPCAKVILTNCYAQRDPESVAQIEGVSLVADNTQKTNLIQLIDKASGNKDDPQIFREEFEKTRHFTPMSAIPFDDRTRPLVKIQDGCDAKCSYCIVPTVRGPSRSVDPDLIVGQVHSLLDQGYREVVLTGIHMGTYGMHLKPRIPLDMLIKRITSRPGNWRLRLSSIEPMELSRKIIERAADSDKISPHFHICLQSGSDRILKKMLRPYNTSRFAAIVEEIRKKLPDSGIGTDVIIGFPGETEEDHKQTVRYLNQLPFTYFHVFPYSDRSGTKASTLNDKVPSKIIKERSQELREMSAYKNHKFRESFIGRNLSVLTLSEFRNGFRESLSGNYLKVLMPKDTPENELARVQIETEKNGFLMGNLLAGPR
jgi:threonylcarbamoyladenosine tRNA methylthiotransferase MtaB